MNFPQHATIDWTPSYQSALSNYLITLCCYNAKGENCPTEIHEPHLKILAGEWGKALGWTLSKSRQFDVGFLTGRKGGDKQVLDADHINLWNKDGQPYAITSQPYADTLGEREGNGSLVDFEEKFSVIRNRVPYSGWHNFPRTHLDIWVRA
jgi:hypothetical protein